MQTLSLDPNNTVSEWVVERPSRARVFEAFGIDYCCGGRRSLADACSAQGLVTEEVIAALLEEPAPLDARDWSTAPLTDLCAHIESTLSGGAPSAAG